MENQAKKQRKKKQLFREFKGKQVFSFWLFWQEEVK